MLYDTELHLSIAVYDKNQIDSPDNLRDVIKLYSYMYMMYPFDSIWQYYHFVTLMPMTALLYIIATESNFYKVWQFSVQLYHLFT